MRTPNLDLQAPAASEIQEDRSNGNGYWMFLPTSPASVFEALPKFAEHSTFTEVGEIAEQLALNGSLLVSGEPGAGKSHLVRDLQTAAVVNNVPTFALALHVNGGSNSGVENAQSKLDEFQEAARETGGLVILDNIDYVAHKGSGSRSRSKARNYAQGIQPIIQKLVDDPNIVVVATAHDDAWREGKWKWQDEDIDGPAHAILEMFPEQVEFEGKMALVGLAHILRERNVVRSANELDEHSVTLGRAAQVIRALHGSGRAKFFYANHISVPDFLRNPQAAVDKVEAGRDERRGKA